MIICDTHNFTFLRIPKNASSSLAEFFIRNFCGPKDKYTEVNDCGIKTQNVSPHLVRLYKENHRFIHLTLQELIDNKVITREDALKKRNIGVIRDPFERQLSLYFFLKKNRNISTEEFRSLFQNGHHNTDPSNRILQTDYVRIDGKDVADWWAYEDIDNRVKKFCEEKKINTKKGLQNYKGNFKPKDNNLLLKYYDQKTIDAVKKYYEKDFEKYYELTGKNHEAI
jgi:hypothetical protein